LAAILPREHPCQRKRAWDLWHIHSFDLVLLTGLKIAEIIIAVSKDTQIEVVLGCAFFRLLEFYHFKRLTWEYGSDGRLGGLLRTRFPFVALDYLTAADFKLRLWRQAIVLAEFRRASQH
jgi:hypothetical protein